MNRSVRVRMAKGLVFGVGVLSVVSACSSTSHATQNLDAVLSSSDRFRYRAQVTSDEAPGFRPLSPLTELVRSLSASLKRSPVEQPTRDVPNPSRVALSNLRELAGSTDGPDAWRHNEQVRLLTRYSRLSPSKLCRERATLELGPHARRLGLDVPYVPLEQEAANAPELLEALDGLVEATTQLVADRQSSTARADFAGAVDVLRGRRIDVASGSRLLRAVAPFLRGSYLPADQRADLEAFSLDVQREMVAESLWASIWDRTSLVRAAGMTTNIEVFGEDFAIEALFSLAPSKRHPEIQAAHSQFALPPVPPIFDEVYLAVSEAYAEHGLPVAATLPSAASVRLRGTLFQALIRISLSEYTFSPRVRNAAMRALQTVSGREVDSLHFEEWEQWWGQAGPALEAEIKALSATRQPTDGPPQRP